MPPRAPSPVGVLLIDKPIAAEFLARFIERVFGSTTTLSQLDPAAQDGQANDLFDAFNFAQAPLPPLVLTPRSCPIDL